jgi:FixJ family two-component response regulator
MIANNSVGRQTTTLKMPGQRSWRDGMDNVAPTVFIVEDAPEVRIALSRMLTVAGYEVRSFDSAERFLSEQDAAAPGCLLLDVCLPGLSGIELQHELKGSQSSRPIIFMTGMADIQTSVRAMKEGAIDFLTKPIDKENLFAAVGQAIHHDTARRAEWAIRRTIDKRLQALTARERQVLEHVIRGRLNKQIGADLGIGEKTVKVHRARVMAKMAVRSVAELVQVCARAGLAKGPASCANVATPNDLVRHSPATMETYLSRKGSMHLSVPCS